MRQLARVFKALSDETRLRILNLLIERECCVCEVMQALDISQTRASRNLSILYNSGFVKAKRSGMWVLYSIDAENIPEKYPLLIDTLKKSLENNDDAKNDKARLKKAKRTILNGVCAQAQSCN